MKPFPLPRVKLSTLATGALLLGGLLAARTAAANPFASCITVTNGTVSFYVNESGGSVVVNYEDGSKNASFNGVSTGTNVAAGLYTFPLNGHTGYAITCHKVGAGSPFQTSTDTNMYCLWDAPRGVDANKNPQIGAFFGRVYVGESTAGTLGTTNQVTYDFKGRGIYDLSPDLSTNLNPGGGTNAAAGGVFTTASSSSPYNVTVGPDNLVYVADYSTANATVFSFDPTFTSFTNVVLNPVGENQGAAAGVHGDPTAVAITGSQAAGNLVVYTFDPDLPTPSTAQLGLGGEGQTVAGDFNNFYAYHIGSTALPYTNAPDQAVCAGLPTFQDSQVGAIAVETNGYVVGMFHRNNFSDGSIQVFDQNFNLLFDSLQNGADPFVSPLTTYGAYADVRISPDSKYLATIDEDNILVICDLTNGLPDESTLFRITNAPNGTAARGIAWDAADNLLECSSGQGLLRVYSLGYSSTSVTTNDITGTNGAFYFSLPAVNASVAVAQPTASQNYVNNSTPGTPIPGDFTVNLNAASLVGPVVVNFTLSGTAVYGTNYTVGTGTNSNGVIISSNSVTFPAGTYPGGGNWSVNIPIIPTATPVSGPTLTVNFNLGGGPSYVPSVPLTGSISILNTGPQVLVISTVTNNSTMFRGTPNDYAEFTITRYGDLNGPGNTPTSISPKTYTVTNFTYSGTAVYPVDYTAQAQILNPPPVNGAPGVQITSGVAVFTNIVGNPVSRANLYVAPTNDTIVISLTSPVTGTNGTSSEGYAYSVLPGSVTLTELDDAIGAEVVLWSDPLTNSAESTNWTLTFASSALGPKTTLPVLIPSYTNNETSDNIGGGTNDFLVLFGNPISSDGITPSPVMMENGWVTALKATVENSVGAVAGVNVFPQGRKFQGNYALRFDMYLSLYGSAARNPYYSGTADRQFALFGIDTTGSNCDWRPTAAVSGGSGTTNADGIWFAIDAGIDSQTPADFDAFASPALPNSGVTADLVSATGESQAGVFKDPPFKGVYSNLGTLGGEPVDQWVSVDVESTAQTNITLYINHSQVLASFSNTNGGGYTNGDIMLGYENPLVNVSDGSAFVYYSNVRVVELSPFILGQPVSLIATQGQNVSFVSSATFATAPLTNIWYTGITNPIVAVQTNTVAGTNLTSTLTLNNVQFGTNYLSVFSDSAGSVTGQVASLEVILGPTNVTANAGATVTFSVTPSGQSAPTAYQWELNGNVLANTLVYAGVTTPTLTITNVQASLGGTYSVLVTSAAGTVTPAATLTVGAPPAPSFSTVSLVGTNLVLSFSSTESGATTGSFTLLSSPVVTGPYVTNTTASFSGSGGAFQITVPHSTTNTSMFYRLQAN